MDKQLKRFTETQLGELEKVTTEIRKRTSISIDDMKRLIDNARAYNALADSLGECLVTTEDELGVVDVEELEKWIAGLSTSSGMPVVGADRIRKLATLAKMAKLRVLRPRDWRQVAIDALLESTPEQDAKAAAVIGAETHDEESVPIDGIELRTEGSTIIVAINVRGKTCEAIRVHGAIRENTVNHHVGPIGLRRVIGFNDVSKPESPYAGIDRSIATEKLSGVKSSAPLDETLMREAAEWMIGADNKRIRVKP